MGKIFCVDFKGTLWNSTQDILPIHWKIWFFIQQWHLRALRFKSSYVFLKRSPGPLSDLLYSFVRRRMDGRQRQPVTHRWSAFPPNEGCVVVNWPKTRIYGQTEPKTMQRHSKGKGVNDQGQIKLQKRKWNQSQLQILQKKKRNSRTSCKTAMKWLKL